MLNGSFSMISPSELRDRMKSSQYEKDMIKAFRLVNQMIEDGLKNGDCMIRLPYDMKLGNLASADDKTDALANRLLQAGFNCKKETKMKNGVMQRPTWYLYFDYI
ncbi:hypothetical protein [Kurthia sibirica]|uniref:Uncharacterized protein n=1 Tax=Kurthia sibirica TaxID=202750 RepID=A0A2U3AGQ3_9BACL|nr:hypothetical protein [Kurthia sibirica]PWI23726.1 hypothetical protein DEX24_15645 [Kurthia sibirica]GEK35507.1 hypothetical protein KSI01_30400 [Kurthia sibirica]